MTREELPERLQSIEWDDIKFKPRSSKQRYALTEAGINLRAWHADQQQANTQRTNHNEND